LARRSFLFCVAGCSQFPLPLCHPSEGSGWLFDYLSSARGPACYTNQQIAKRTTSVTSITFARNTHEREERNLEALGLASRQEFVPIAPELCFVRLIPRKPSHHNSIENPHLSFTLISITHEYVNSIRKLRQRPRLASGRQQLRTPWCIW
jgi:hypothetical protein